MKTLNELKKVFVGIWIASLMIIPTVYTFQGDSFGEIIDYVIRYPEEILMELGIGTVSCVLTYLAYVLYKGVKSDVIEVIEYFKKKKEAKKA